MYVPNFYDLYCHILFLHHDTKIASYIEHWKILELVSQSY